MSPPNTPGTVIETNGLTKRYRGLTAVDDLNLSVPAGSICAFLGPNGSGKTTTIKMLLGLVRPSSGEAHIFGFPATDESASVRIRARTGFVGEDKRIYGYMTAGQVIDLVRSAYPAWDAAHAAALVKRFDLPLDRNCAKLSKGMRTKLALLLALARRADLLILDEPSEGLDPVSAEQLLEAVVHAASEGVTVFFSTHQIAEAERIADTVCIMDSGRLVFQCLMEDLRANHRRVHASFPIRVPEKALHLTGAASPRVDGHVLSFTVREYADRIANDARALGALSVDVQPMTLRDVFLDSVAGGRE